MTYLDIFRSLINPLPVKTELTRIVSERIELFKTALDENHDEVWLQNKLNERHLAKIQVRFPEELVLLFCLRANKERNAGYDYNKAKTLYKNLFEKYELKFKRNTKKTMTLRDLYIFIIENSSNYESFDSSIGQQTQNIIQDFSNVKTENELEKLYCKHIELMTPVSNAVKYFTSRYIFFLICARIFEFKDILLLLSQGTTKDAYKYLLDEREKSKNECRNTLIEWTLKSKLLNNFDEDNKGETFRFSVDSNNQGTQYECLGKNIVSHLISTLPLYGGNSDDVERISPLFKQTKNNMTSIKLQLSQLRDQTSIFKGIGPAFDPVKHDAMVESINNLQIEDFFGFKLNYNVLFNDLYQNIDGPGAEKINFDDNNLLNNSDYRNEYIGSLLRGKRDISRTSLLLLLISVRGILKLENHFVKQPIPLYNKDTDKLNVRRINQILNRVGFLDLEETEDAISFDDSCRKYFDSEDFRAIFALSKAISDTDQIKIPIEIAELDGIDARRLLFDEGERSEK